MPGLVPPVPACPASDNAKVVCHCPKKPEHPKKTNKTRLRGSRKALEKHRFRGGQKKVREILKKVGLILNYVPCIFFFLPAGFWRTVKNV